MALGISVEGKKEVLGLGIEPNEGAKFWLKVVTELKNRGVLAALSEFERKWGDRYPMVREERRMFEGQLPACPERAYTEIWTRSLWTRNAPI